MDKDPKAKSRGIGRGKDVKDHPELLLAFRRQSLLSGLSGASCGGWTFGHAMAVVAEFAERLGAIVSVEALGHALAAATRDLGFRYFALVQHGDIVERPAAQLLLHNYPRRWARRFASDRLHRVDPVQRAAASAVIGFAWRDLEVRETEGMRTLMAAARAAGLGEGFTVPLHLAGERIASCSFVTRPGQALPDKALLAAQLLGQLAYTTALELTRSAHRSNIQLSPRQRECVALMAHGKSDWEIGQILGLKEDTVTKYLNAARARYGVARRTQLLLFALRFGEIGFADLNWQYPP